MKQSFTEEKKEIRQQIWDLIDVRKGMKVLDIGIGEEAISAHAMVGLGARVTSIDKNLRLLTAQESIDATLVCADASALPFIRNSFDLSLAYFCLHEIHPEMHQGVFAELVRTSNRIAVVEPNPGDDELYKRYWNILNRAGRSMDECEIYQEIGYWINCLVSQGAHIIQEKKIRHQRKLIGKDGVDFFQRIIGQLRDYGIGESFLAELTILCKEVEKYGALFSDISVIMARCA